MAQLFGFEIKRANRQDDLPAIIPPITDDGAVVVNGGGVYGQFIDMDGTVRTEGELINKYREMAEHPEVEAAVDDITNEAIVFDENIPTCEIVLDKIDLPDTIKEALTYEFESIKSMLEFDNHPYEVFKRWYIDGRLYYQVVINPAEPDAGIQELRYIDPRKIRKIREVSQSRDPRTGAPLVQIKAEYYIFNDKGFSSQGSGLSTSINPGTSLGVRIANDSIIQSTSGIISSKGDTVLSYLHKAIKPVNMLRSLEDSLVIYRISRAPERRIFYIDVGNLPKAKAEQYLRDTMVRFKNKIVYDASTGTIRDDRKFMTMLEDFWLPRREGGRGTEITTLPGGQNLNQIDDIIFFQRKLFRSLNVPITRLDPEAMFNYGRANEITRDEVKFVKFIDRLRMKFSELFLRCLETQTILKGIFTPEEWPIIAQGIKFKYAKDSYFEELKEGEIMATRMELLTGVMPIIGKYVSNEWARKTILKQTDEQMKIEDQQIIEEFSNPLYNPPEPPEMEGEQPGGPAAGGGQQPKPKAKSSKPQSKGKR